jgi:hypothetical protein
MHVHVNVHTGVCPVKGVRRVSTCFSVLDKGVSKSPSLFLPLFGANCVNVGDGCVWSFTGKVINGEVCFVSSFLRVFFGANCENVGDGCVWSDNGTATAMGEVCLVSSLIPWNTAIIDKGLGGENSICMSSSVMSFGSGELGCYVCVHICVCVCVRAYICMYVCVCIYIYISMHVWVSVKFLVHVYEHIYTAHAHACTHAHTSTRHTCTSTYPGSKLFHTPILSFHAVHTKHIHIYTRIHIHTHIHK